MLSSFKQQCDLLKPFSGHVDLRSSECASCIVPTCPPTHRQYLLVLLNKQTAWRCPCCSSSMLSSRLVPTTPAPTHCRHKLLHCPAAANNLSGVQPHQQQQRHAQEQRQEELRTRQQVSATQQQQEQQQQQLQLRLSPPGRKYVQLWKTKRPGRKPRLLDGELRMCVCLP